MSGRQSKRRRDKFSGTTLSTSFTGHQSTDRVLPSTPCKNPPLQIPPKSAAQSSSSSLNSDNGPPPELLLLEADLWKKFHDEHNEMIITNVGRCLFPCLKFKAIKLDPNALYSLRLDFEILSPDRFRFSNGSWKPVESAEHADDGTQVGNYYTHPDGFQLGSHWMANPISFAEVKLTNKVESQSSIVKRGAGKNKVESGNTGNGDDFDVPHGNTTLGGADRVNSNVFHVKSFRKYRPRLCLIQWDKGSSAILKSTTHCFDRSAFIAVTHYQNEKVNNLKKAHNPHAKGLRGTTGKESLPVEIQVGQHQQQQKRRAPDSQSSSTTHLSRPNKRSRTSWRSDMIDSDEGVGSGDGDLNGDDIDMSAVADVGTRGGRGRDGRTTNRSRSKAVSATGRSTFAARVPPEVEMNNIPPPPTLSWHQQFLRDNNTTNIPQDTLPTAAATSPVGPSNDDPPGPLSCQLGTADPATVGATHSAQVSASAIPSSTLNSHGRESGAGTGNGGFQRDPRMMKSTILESETSMSTPSATSIRPPSLHEFPHQAELDRVLHENRWLRAFIRHHYGPKVEAEADAAIAMEQRFL